MPSRPREAELGPGVGVPQMQLLGPDQGLMWAACSGSVEPMRLKLETMPYGIRDAIKISWQLEDE